MANILLVEDDRALGRGISFALEKDGHLVTRAGCYADAMEAFGSQEFGLLLLDIGLPDKSGRELCSDIRKQSDVPLIFLTANDTEDDVMLGFDLGCDDYLSKPFSLGILRQRVNAVLRRSTASSQQQTLVYRGLTIHFQNKLVRKGGKDIRLTATEWRLLEALASNRGQVMTRTVLLEKLWDSGGNFVDENALSVNIRRLRQKIEDDPTKPLYIHTVFGIGYTFGE